MAGEAKPIAKLREKFGYQNVMYAAAGEIVAKTSGMSWENFVAEKIFKPLGMTNSSVSVEDMKKAKDFSFGYDYNSDIKETRFLPLRDIKETAPAGAINSSARDMANWLRFMLNGGVTPDGKRLVSENLFAELTKPQMKITDKMHYGLGWMLQDFKGLKLVQHGGNIDGFNAMVAMIPEKKIGFALLTNVTNSSLTSEIFGIVFNNLLFPTTPEKTVAGNANESGAKLPAEKIIGTYKFKEAGFNVEIANKDGKLTMNVPAQPRYTLENVSGNKYKMSPLPDGFFATFRPSAGNPNEVELVLDQPNKSFVLARATAADLTEAVKKAESFGEFAGTYESKDNPASKAEIAVKDAALTITLTGQPTLALIEKGKDVFAFNGLPAAYQMEVKRDASNKIVSVVFNQPEGKFEYTRIGGNAANNAPTVNVDELMAKVANALGGEANWKKLNSRVTKFEIDLVHQGVKGFGTSYAKAPNMTATELKFIALGKEIGTSFDYFNGTEGGQFLSFAPPEKYTGKQFEDAKIEADFYGLVNWKANYKTASVKGTSKVGDEEVYVLVLEPEKGNKDTIYISTKTFLPLKLESVISSSTSGIDIPYSQAMSDYREIDGVKIPFRVVNSNIANGTL